MKDLIAILRFAENRRDQLSELRVIRLLPGVGPKAARRILDHIAQPGASHKDAPQPKNAGQAWSDYLDLHAELQSPARAWPTNFERARSWYEPHLERVHEDAAQRLGDVIQLEQIAGSFPSRERFLTELTLDPPQSTSNLAGAPSKDDEYLILLTIHSAKRQEWKSVYVLNCIDGCIPSDMATGSSDEIEEERRLLYVAMTRAKDDLHLITTLRFYAHGQAARRDRHVYGGRSRFIPQHILGKFEQRSWTSRRVAEAKSRTVAPRDLKARVLDKYL